MEQRTISAKDVLALLRERYSNGEEWVCASEVQRTTGWSDRRYDFVAMNCWNSNFYKIEVVEIKVSKSDLRRELEEPEKHNVMFDDIDYYSLAAPDKIIDMSIIPPKWGVYAVVDGKLVTKRKPLALHDEPRTTLPRAFAASFLRAATAQNLERKLLSDEKQKAFEEGYARAKKDIGQMADSWDNYNRIQKENRQLSQTLSDLGIYGLESQQDKANINRLKRLKQIGDELDWLKHLTKQVKKCVADIEQATGEIEKRDGCNGDLTNAPQI
jgi:hypothetical protein